MTKSKGKVKSGNTSHSHTTDNHSNGLYSVSEAKRLESGHITVTGTIASVSTLYKMISKSEWHCDNPGCDGGNYGSQRYDPPILLPPPHLDSRFCIKCKSTAFFVKHEFQNVRTLQLVDLDKTETENAADTLEVIAFDEASENVLAGEPVEIVGDLYIERTLDGGKGKRLITVLHSNQLTYTLKKEITLTSEDVEIFKRHKQICDAAYKREFEAADRAEPWAKKIVPMSYVDRLVSMFAPNVIGHNDKKVGLLRSIVGGRTDSGGGNDNGRRGRINTMLVGDPGTAKSRLGREATKILPNSRYVTAQHASGRTLVAMVDLVNDMRLLRLGAVVLSKGSVCVVNEFGSMSMEEQQYLTDIAEEGHCSVDKYAVHFEIDSPTTIIATANPYNGVWNKSSMIAKDEIPALRTFIDRCDQIYGFRDAPSEREILEYTKIKSAIRKRRPHNYNFLKKLLTFMKTKIDPILTNDAEDRLNQFWTKAKIEGIVTNRVYDSLFRLAEAQARLNLSGEVNDEIATQTMDSMKLMLSQYGQFVDTVESPRDLAYRAFYHILKRLKVGITVKELCQIACEENQAIHAYLGDNYYMEHNRKIKPIIDILLNTHSENVKLVKQKPTVLQYLEANEHMDSKQSDRRYNHLSDTTDLSDITKTSQENDYFMKNQLQTQDQTETPSNQTPAQIQTKNMQIKTMSDRSDRSDNRRIFWNDSCGFGCYYCSECFLSDLERLTHREQEHPAKLNYPTPKEFENRLSPNR
jgi:DNA replicative helicase MCM subunit Mcm2 (Cdc46/Mcm family)